jgi:hypothetical protein
MFYTTQPGGFYGGGMGNEGAMRPPMMAGNPFGPAFQIPGKKPGGQPVLPGENKEAIEGVYGRPGPQPMRGISPMGLPMAMGSSNLPNAIGNMAGVANSQFYKGPQLGQAGLYFGGVM